MSKHLYGCVRDSRDARDFMFAAGKKIDPNTIADSADIISGFPGVVDQGTLGSCTSNAMVAGYFEFMRLKNGYAQEDFSRLFHYYCERNYEGTIEEDSGASLRDGMKVLAKIGVCKESSYPYDISKFTEKPSDMAYKEASGNKILTYNRIGSILELKKSLSDGVPVVLGFSVYESFESSDVDSTGIVPAPKSGEQCLGGHCVVAAKYTPTEIVFRNSYGTDWGKAGYGSMSYDVFSQLVFDMWTGTMDAKEVA